MLANYGVFSSAKYVSTGATNTATITVTSDNVDIYVVQAGGSAPFTVAIDGGSDVVVGNSTSAGNTVKYNVATGSVGSHTIVIKAPASGTLYLVGLSANIGSSGCQVHNCGLTSTLISDFAYGHNSDYVTALAPNLTIIALDTNDHNNQSDLTSYRSYFTTVIQKALVSGSVLLLGGCNDNISKPIPQKAYHAVLMSLARQYNCAFISIYDRWKDWATANSMGLMYDTQHPNVKGHADYAVGILRHIIEVQ